MKNKNGQVRIVGRVKDRMVLLGTSLVFEANERVELWPATNLPQKGLFFATKIGGQDGIVVSPEEFVEESREIVGSLD